MRGLPRTFWYLWTGALIDRLGTFVYTFLALYLTRARHFTVAQRASSSRCGAPATSPPGPSVATSPITSGGGARCCSAFTLSAAAMLQPRPRARRRGTSPSPPPLLGFCGNLFRPAMHATVADVVRAGRSHARLRLPLLGGQPRLRRRGDARRLHGRAQLHAPLRRRRGDDARCSASSSTCACPRRIPSATSSAARGPTCACRCAIGRSSSSCSRSCLVMLVGSQGNSTLPIDLRDHGIAPSTYGWLLAINGVMIVAASSRPRSRWVQRFDRGRVLALGALLQGIGFGLTCRRPLASAGTRSPSSCGHCAELLLLAGVAGRRQRSGADAACAAPTRASTRWRGARRACLAPALGSLVLGRFGSVALWSSCFAVCLVAVVLHLPRGAAYTRHVSAETPPE